MLDPDKRATIIAFALSFLLANMDDPDVADDLQDREITEDEIHLLFEETNTI